MKEQGSIVQLFVRDGESGRFVKRLDVREEVGEGATGSTSEVVRNGSDYVFGTPRRDEEIRKSREEVLQRLH